MIRPLRTSLITPFPKRRHCSPKYGIVKFLSTLFSKARWEGTRRNPLMLEFDQIVRVGMRFLTPSLVQTLSIKDSI